MWSHDAIISTGGSTRTRLISVRQERLGSPTGYIDAAHQLCLEKIENLTPVDSS